MLHVAGIDDVFLKTNQQVSKFGVTVSPSQRPSPLWYVFFMMFFFDPSKWNKMFHDVSGSPKNPKIKGRDPWNSNHGTSGGCGKLLRIVPNMDLMDASAKKTLSSNQIALFPLGFGTSVKSQYIYIKTAEVDTVSMVHAIPLSPPSFHPVAKMTP